MSNTSTMAKKEREAISSSLVKARLACEALDNFPGDLPTSLSEAYAIQEISIASWPDKIVGWKIGGIPPQFLDQYDEVRLTGPIYEKSVKTISDDEVQMPVFKDGFAAVEAEFVIKVGQDIPPNTLKGDDDAVLDMIEAIHIGVEIASSPMAEVNNLGPMCIISDNGNNAGLILGPEVKDWRTKPFEDMPVRVDIEGKTVGDANGAGIPGGPLGAFRFLVDHFTKRGRTIQKGSLISTGAVTGVHQSYIGESSILDFGVYGKFLVKLVPAKAQ